MANKDEIGYAKPPSRKRKSLKGLLGNFGEVVVLDWGLAKLVDAPERATTTRRVLCSTKLD